ncbi:MAG: NUDIX hydrolase [Candidatus Riflebacteria bacterium]|nr:NUDIX hydrolase [Candidatus Riflebacteria bacterium]
MLIQRKHDPFSGKWALPGGFLEMDETLKTGALRELGEETQIFNVKLYPVFVCGEPGRDPRGRTITQLFGALVDSSSLNPTGADDAAEAEWFPINSLPEMAFDHQRVLFQIFSNLKWQAEISIIGKDYFSFEAEEEKIVDLHSLVLGTKNIESPILRGKKLGLLAPVSGHKFRYLCPDLKGPDWHPLVW